MSYLLLDYEHIEKHRAFDGLYVIIIIQNAFFIFCLIINHLRQKVFVIEKLVLI